MHTLDQLKSGALKGITRLDLSANLDYFPEEIFSLADSLEVLNLSGNQLATLPDDLPRLHKLKVIFCSDNPFTELPEVLGACENLEMVGFKACQIKTVSPKALPKKLRWLILTDNVIEALPDELGQCERLQKLMLSGNRLTHLPDLSACTNLELIRLAANQLSSLPEWLFNLPRLAWLAFAGNPIALNPPAAEADFTGALTLGALLGQGASGMVYEVTHQATLCAYKRFKGQMTSDGLPANEIAATLRAGTHPNLIKPYGTFLEDGETTPGLLLEKLAANYQVLAGPPTLASCTRDHYKEVRFTQPWVLDVLTQCALVLEHLHARGILHGDFYAHNLLINEQGHVLLSDFGAATLYRPEDAQALMRLEVCAFGYLLEELTSRATLTPDCRDELMALYQACTQAPQLRPTFTDIAASFKALAV